MASRTWRAADAQLGDTDAAAQMAPDLLTRIPSPLAYRLGLRPAPRPSVKVRIIGCSITCKRCGRVVTEVGLFTLDRPLCSACLDSVGQADVGGQRLGRAASPGPV